MATAAVPSTTLTPDEELADLLGGEHRRRAVVASMVASIRASMRRGGGEGAIRFETSATVVRRVLRNDVVVV